MNFTNNVMHSVLIDGLNNPGFSGGPVYFQPIGQKEKHCVAAIISSYRYNWEPIYIKGVKTDAQYQFNTGIVIAYTINHAVDLIDNNPIGFEINS